MKNAQQMRHLQSKITNARLRWDLDHEDCMIANAISSTLSWVLDETDISPIELIVLPDDDRQISS